MEQQQNNCFNCKFFRLHYIKSHSRFYDLHCGHCVGRNLTAKEKRGFPFVDGCEMWESDEEKKAERRRNIIETIEIMCERLNEIKQILKEDTK